jgi:hypothetical protein
MRISWDKYIIYLVSIECRSDKLQEKYKHELKSMYSDTNVDRLF